MTIWFWGIFSLMGAGAGPLFGTGGEQAQSLYHLYLKDYDDVDVDTATYLDSNCPYDTYVRESNWVDIDFACLLADLCEQNPEPEVIDLKHRYISKKRLRRLVSAIGGNGVVQHLDLRDSGIDDAGAQLIAAAFAENRSLKSLDLRKNSISIIGIYHLLSGLAHNRSLEMLRYDSEWRPGKDEEAYLYYKLLTAVLKENWKIQHLPWMESLRGPFYEKYPLPGFTRIPEDDTQITWSHAVRSLLQSWFPTDNLNSLFGKSDHPVLKIGTRKILSSSLTTLLLCGHRQADGGRLPRLPVEMWLTILSFLRVGDLLPIKIPNRLRRRPFDPGKQDLLLDFGDQGKVYWRHCREGVPAGFTPADLNATGTFPELLFRYDSGLAFKVGNYVMPEGRDSEVVDEWREWATAFPRYPESISTIWTLMAVSGSPTVFKLYVFKSPYPREILSLGKYKGELVGEFSVKICLPH